MKRMIAAMLCALPLTMAGCTLTEPPQVLALAGCAEAGETLVFGSYEQDGDPENGAEPILWRVIAKSEDEMLLLSEYPLAQMPYHGSEAAVTWESCSLRSWLNDEFYRAAFTAEEQARIIEAQIENPSSRKFFSSVSLLYSAEGGASTTDRVFLLSCTEAQAYLGLKAWYHGEDDSKYAVSACVCTPQQFGGEAPRPVSWWLRSPGTTQYFAADVAAIGAGDQSRVQTESAVRPAIRLRTPQDPA